MRAAILKAIDLIDVALPQGEDGWLVFGPDDGGVELEIVAAVEAGGLNIIHAMIKR